MISVPRSPAPQFFIDYVKSVGGPGGPLIMTTEPYGYPYALREAIVFELFRPFAGKCAYCESQLHSKSHAEVDQFRPRNLFGAPATLDWNNLLLACGVCNRNKADRFPVRPGQDQAARSYQESLALDRPLLLNPCRDEPDDHLRFTPDGFVHGLTQRGQITISTLDLNRLQLVGARRQKALDVLSPEFEVTKLDVTSPFSASSAHALRQLRDDAFRAEVERARLLQTHYDEEREQVATDQEDGLRDYSAFERYIERIDLLNIGTLSALTLDLLATEQSRNPCFALLGENGIGKSTILRAIACALAGPAYARKLRLTSNSLLASGAATGAITVRVTGYRNPVTVALRRGRPLAYNSAGAKTLVLAYGASRLLAAGRHKADPGERHAKIRNLFDPFVPVSDANNWLDNLDPRHLDDVHATLERILADTADMQPSRAPVVDASQGKLRFKVGDGTPRPVTALSDGYKALIGMAGDIMAVMHTARFDRMADAMGIVLVDELGNHFHPQLKLRIVGALRAAFPKIQFIFTTHEPLCLRGMGQGEIGVLRRDGQGVYLLTDLPDPTTMRIDQLLASEHFGLESTVDPARAAEIRRYHELVRKTERSTDEQATLDQLQATLGQTDYLGGSRRERMLLNLLDMHDTEPVRSPGNNVSADALSRRTLARLKDIMRAVAPGTTDGGGAQ